VALPAGITTATVTAGVAQTFSGAFTRQHITITPSASLIHTATGIPLVNFMEEIASTEGVAGQFVLPHTDQDGFQDEAGNAYKNWYYTATIQYQTDRATLPAKTKTFQLTSGQTVVDLDLLPTGVPAMPYTAPVAGVTSVNGQTGSVLVEGATDAAVAEQVTSGPETVAALSATYVPANPTLEVVYNPDGSVQSTDEDGVLTTFTYNPDGTVATQTRAGVTKTFTYNADGNVTGAA
jgi:YD repeat-containing protein